MTEAPFSFRELKEADERKIVPVESFQASDEVSLAYRCYLPQTFDAVLLFYHGGGGGAHSGAGYQYMSQGLCSQYGLAVYTPDIRGYGTSGGARGDASSVKRVMLDITEFIRYIRQEHPGKRIFLGGHSSGAGLVLNYLSRSEHETVAGYVFLSPKFRAREVDRNEGFKKPFSSAFIPAFAIHAMSGGLLMGHYKAVRLNYPPDILERDPLLVPFCTVNMALALTPASADRQIQTIDRPFGLWIGEDDEIISVPWVLSQAEKMPAVSTSGIIAGANHLSILLHAHTTIGSWIVQQINEKY